MTTKVRLSGIPTPDEALVTMRQLFPDDGLYEIVKAATETEDAFETWFLTELERVARERFVNGQLAIWDALDALLRRRGVEVPSQLDAWELARSLFDLSVGATSHMVGIAVAPDVAQWLQGLGFTVPEILDFPGTAYRCGLIYDQLAASPAVPFRALKELVENAVPLTATEHAAIAYARQHAGMYGLCSGSDQVNTASLHRFVLGNASFPVSALIFGCETLIVDHPGAWHGQGPLFDPEKLVLGAIEGLYGGVMSSNPKP